MFCPESRTHVKLSSMVARDFSMQELLITLYAENNYFDKFSFNINFIKHGENSDRSSGTNQVNEGLSQRGGGSSHPTNGPASLSENSIFELELTPLRRVLRRGGGGCQLRNVCGSVGILAKFSAYLVDLHVKEKRMQIPLECV